MKEGFKNCASLSEGTPLAGPGGRAPLLGTPKDTFSKSLEWASVSLWAPLLGNMEGRSFPRVFEIKSYVKMPCKRVSLSIGAPMGNLKGIRLPGLFGAQRAHL
jgi:hypothetical protein